MVEQVVVVGGGAAGMMAAGRAAELGAAVLLLEKTPRLGNKLRITGKGRCNLTNESEAASFLAHLRPEGVFFRNALARFGPADLCAFFAARGVPTVVERGGRVFPSSNSADDVAEALRGYCLQHGVRLRYRAEVAEVLRDDAGVRGVRLADGREVAARRVVLATGGASYPGTGSTGDGYALLQRLGHAVSPPRPGLVPLEVADRDVPALQGLALRNVRATLLAGERPLESAFGELLFTHFGVSGPIVLTLSMALPPEPTQPLRLRLDLKPTLNAETLDARLVREAAALGRASYRALLRRLVPAALADLLAARSGIASSERVSQLTGAERARTVSLLKSLELTVAGTRPIEEAIITLGGVCTREIEPRTMASRLVPGLYVAGELLDLAGDTGGYNLQVAFTSGRLAGEAAAA